MTRAMHVHASVTGSTTLLYLNPNETTTCTSTCISYTSENGETTIMPLFAIHNLNQGSGSREGNRESRWGYLGKLEKNLFVPHLFSPPVKKRLAFRPRQGRRKTKARSGRIRNNVAPWPEKQRRRSVVLPLRDSSRGLPGSVLRDRVWSLLCPNGSYFFFLGSYIVWNPKGILYDVEFLSLFSFSLNFSKLEWQIMEERTWLKAAVIVCLFAVSNGRGIGLMRLLIF